MQPPQPNAVPKAVFFGFFDKHWAAGSGRPPAPARSFSHWSSKEFADALSRNGASADTDTIDKWKRHAHLPRQQQFNAILNVFFADDPNHADAAPMRQAWTDASTRTPRKPRRPAANPSDFRITHRHDIPGLVEFKAHPTPGNSEDTFRLDATLRFATLTYDHNETPVEVALTDAEITIASDAYQYVQGSRVCDRSDHAYLKDRAGNIGVEGPMRRDALHGDPLGTDHLAIMRRTDNDEGPVTVEIRARTLQVRVEAQDQPVSINRKAIIDAILGEGERRDPLGRLVFARARITRRAAS